MLRVSVVVASLTALLGLAREPGCGTAGDGDATANAPCTRARDCADGLTCSEGVCTPLDAGTASEAASSATDAASEDSGS